MTLLELMNAHRSIRKYRPDPVSEDHLREILHAATRASSSGNMQTYSIITTRDAARRDALWKMHFEQDMIRQAPLLLTFCADWNRMIRWCTQSGAEPGFDNFLSFLVGFADAVIAAQNAALAAEALGYGICYMGTTLCAPDALIEFFGLPEHVFPVTTLVVGVPDEDPECRARLPIESIVHAERYADYDDPRIQETYRARETEGWARYMSFPDLAAEITSSGVRNLAEIYTVLKYTKQGNEEIADELLAALHRHGFLRGSRDAGHGPAGTDGLAGDHSAE